jgi:predicted DNA-binding protein
MKDSRVTVRLSLDTRRGLQAAARGIGKRESDLIRDAVERHLPPSKTRSPPTITPKRLDW